ncbi:MAG: hypothetical protein R2699_03475 [Acidimicrobiales bacterium]
MRNYILGGIVGLLLVAIVTANFVRLPYYVISPGQVRPTQDAVQVEGRPTAIATPARSATRPCPRARRRRGAR